MIDGYEEDERIKYNIIARLEALNNKIKDEYGIDIDYIDEKDLKNSR